MRKGDEADRTRHGKVSGKKRPETCVRNDSKSFRLSVMILEARGAKRGRWLCAYACHDRKRVRSPEYTFQREAVSRWNKKIWEDNYQRENAKRNRKDENNIIYVLCIGHETIHKHVHPHPHTHIHTRTNIRNTRIHTKKKPKKYLSIILPSNELTRGW